MQETEVTDVSEIVSIEKYYISGEDYNLMSKRCGTFIGAAEKTIDQMNYWGNEFTKIIENKEFIPGGRILANAGTYFDDLNSEQRLYLKKYIENYNHSEIRTGQMLNCYVVPINDSKHGPGGIYESLEDSSDILSGEGGVGQNFSNLRPEGWVIAGNKRYKSSGPVSFIKLYNSNSEELRQGKGRRGANMAILNIDHPDILKFIKCKRIEGSIKNYNISVGITDDFMNAVKNNSEWNLKWNGENVSTVDAKFLFDEICKNIWTDGGGGEPGFIFLDTAKRFWPFPNETPTTTNPCGEQFLGFYEACDLGALNLVKFLKFVDGAFIFNMERFKDVIYKAIRFLDNVLDLNNYPLKYRNNISRDISMRHRRIGLGIMGLADTLMLCGFGYGSNESLSFINVIMNAFNEFSHESSMSIGQEKGPFLDHLESINIYHGRRNCATTTIAPTGTSGMVAGVWGGCEPYFGLVTRKKTTDGSGITYYIVADPFRKVCELNGVELTDQRLEEIYNNKGTVQGLSWVPKKVQEICRTAMDISPIDHVRVQCALQKHIENSISKTINLPRSGTLKDVADCFMALWEGGAKGGTIYRDGTRELQIMNVGGSENPKLDLTDKEIETRPDVMPGKTYKIVTNITHKPENIYVTVNEDANKKPFEIFVHNADEQNMIAFLDFLINNDVKPDIAQMICGKMSQISKENIAVTTRLISLCMRYNVPIDAIVKQLRKINSADLYNIHKKIGKILSEYVKEPMVLDICQNMVGGKMCGGKLMSQAGCLQCDTCNSSKCD